MDTSQLASWIRSNAEVIAAFFLSTPGFATIAYNAFGKPSLPEVAFTPKNASWVNVEPPSEESAADRKRRLCRERTRRWRERCRLVSVQDASRGRVSLGSDMGSKRGECEGGERGEKRTPFFASQQERHTASQSVTQPSILSQNQGSSATERHTSVTQASQQRHSVTGASQPASLIPEPPPKRKGFYSEIPDDLMEPKLASDLERTLWTEWLEYRKAKHGTRGGKCTAKSVQLWLKTFRQIASTGQDNLKESIKVAIESNWTMFHAKRHDASRSATKASQAPVTWQTGHRPDIHESYMQRLKTLYPDKSVARLIHDYFVEKAGRYPTGRAHWLKILGLDLKHYKVPDDVIERVIASAAEKWPDPLDKGKQPG